MSETPCGDPPKADSGFGRFVWKALKDELTRDALWKALKNVGLLFGTVLCWGLARELWRGEIKPPYLWPSPHAWNQIMYGSVLILVLLGIVAVTIYIVRSIRPWR